MKKVMISDLKCNGSTVAATFQGYLQQNATPWACHHDIADCKLTVTPPRVVKVHLDKQWETVHRPKPAL
jgi:hypothetical protein